MHGAEAEIFDFSAGSMMKATELAEFDVAAQESCRSYT